LLQEISRRLAMKVQDVMVKNVTVCRPNTNLAALAELLWCGACGSLPVLDESGRVTSMITDRDVCIALGTRDRKASDVKVRDVSLPRVFTCAPDDDLRAALKTMESQGIHRLPVVDSHGDLAGILSIDDVVLRAVNHPTTSQIGYEDVMQTLKAIVEYRAREHGQVALARA
jgi:CBS domain-containing protein